MSLLRIQFPAEINCQLACQNISLIFQLTYAKKTDSLSKKEAAEVVRSSASCKFAYPQCLPEVLSVHNYFIINSHSHLLTGIGAVIVEEKKFWESNGKWIISTNSRC